MENKKIILARNHIAYIQIKKFHFFAQKTIFLKIKIVCQIVWTKFCFTVYRL